MSGFLQFATPWGVGKLSTVPSTLGSNHLPPYNLRSCKEGN